MRIQPEFPEYHHNDPKRQAELRVYQEIANSQRPGQALYGVKAARHSPEVDFVVWIEDVACFALEVKGGNFWVENGTLFRQGPIGPEQVANPLRKAMDGALSISNSIKDRLPGGAFVISVLLFPDMEVEDDIRRWAQDSRTNVMFGVTDLVRRLTELEDVQHIRIRPSAHLIEQEVAVLMPEARPEVNPAAPPKDLPTALRAQHVEIHNLVINLYATLSPVVDPLRGPETHDEGDDGNPEKEACA